MNNLTISLDNIIFLIRSIKDQLPPEDQYPKNQSSLTNLAYYYRLYGIADFLLSCDIKKFVHALFCAGQSRLYYLKGCEAGLTGDDRNFITSKNFAFFDTLAINDIATSTQLAQLCDNRWNKSIEYEEDFLFLHFLQNQFLAECGLRSLQNINDILERFKIVLDGKESIFYNMCLGLQKMDAENFNDSLYLIQKNRQENYSKYKKLSELPQIILSTESYVDIQGIAIVKIAQRLGLDTLKEYPMVPSILIDFPKMEFPDRNVWRKFEIII